MTTPSQPAGLAQPLEMPRRVRPEAYLLAIVLTGLTLVARILLQGMVEGPMLIVFTLPVVLSAYWGGLGPGLLATVLSCVGTSHFVLPTMPGFESDSPWHDWHMLVLLVTGTVISLICESLLQAQRRLESNLVETGLARDELRESEELFAKSFRLSPDCVAIIRLPDRVVIKANDALCALWGVTSEAVIGTPTREYSTWLDEEERLSFMRKLEETGECLNCRTRFRMADGRLLDFEVSARLINYRGESCVLSVMRDVTERRQTEVAAARLAAIVEFTDDAIIGRDLSGIVTSWNAVAEEVFGYSASEMIGQPITRLIPVGHHWEEAEVLALVSRGEIARHLETVRIGKDGELIDVSVTTSPIKDKAGRIIGASKLVRDISERKRARENAAREQARFKLIFETVPVGIALATQHPDGESTRIINDAHLRICGLTREQDRIPGIYGRITHPEDLVRQNELLGPPDARKVNELSLEKRYVRLDGTLVWVDFSYQRQDFPGGGYQELTTVADITERKQAEERFRTMANSIPQLAWIARADGHIFWYNDRWYDYTGATPGQMDGWDWQSVHHPEFLPKVMGKWQASIAAGDPFEMEFPLRGADGEYRVFLTRSQPLKDPDGRVVQWIGTNTDVDALKRMEKSLLDSQTRLNSTLSAGSIGTWSWDIPNDNLTADEFTARMFSVDPAAAARGLPAGAYLSAVLEEDQPGVQKALAEAIQSCGHYDIEYQVTQVEGRPRWLQAKGRVQGDAEGNATSFHGAVMDITARKQADQAIRQSEEYFRFLNDLSEATRTLADPSEIMTVMARMLGEHLGASRCAYADVESDGERFTILHDYTDGCASTVGQYQLSLFGARAVATLQSGRTLIICDVDAELAAEEGAEMFRSIGIQSIITCPLVKAGVLRAMMAVHQVTPRVWNPGEIAMVQDVVERCWATIERRSAEEKIHRLNASLEHRVKKRTAQLESANKELEAFSYTVSHDLRTPLRAMDGFSQAVLEDYGDVVPEECRYYLRTIRGGAQKMAALIDDLLAFSRLSRLPLSKKKVDVGALVRGVLTDLEAQKSDRRIDWEIGDLPPCDGDPALLRQVWTNLLSNAVKYTRQREEARVEIGCEITPDGHTYFVRDNGTGFDMRYADKLFGVFQRLHRAEDFEGTGVGLAIVQRIVHRHGGKIWADAEVDRGAAFYFTLEGQN